MRKTGLDSPSPSRAQRDGVKRDPGNGRDQMDVSAPTAQSLWRFFWLIFALSVPLWGIGAVINGLLPRETPVFTALNLAWHISLALIPMAAALILVRQERRPDGVKTLLRRPFDYARIRHKAWYFVIFPFFPSLMLLEYALLKWMGRPLADLRFPGGMVLVMFVVLFAAGIGEELGWSGYALDPLQDRWGALGASVLLGGVSVLWHLVPILQEPHTPLWIVWHSAAMIPLRVILVWLYNNTGKSMFAVVSFHAMVNIGEVVWPFYGISGDYDPLITTILLTITAAIIIYLWGPRTLARYRWAARPVR